MDKNLQLLDRYDREKNIYELICKLAERAHSIINGGSTASENRELNPIQIAMEELLKQETQSEQ